MASKSNPLHIVRIDVDKPHSQHCWEVKIIRVTGNSFHRSFSDSKYGGKDGALVAAIKCRDKELKERPALNSYEQAMKLKKTNRSGIVGVRYGIKEVRRGTKTWKYRAWIVTGTPISGGPSKTKYFVLNVWGREAKEAAIEQRKEWEESLKRSVEKRLTK